MYRSLFKILQIKKALHEIPEPLKHRVQRAFFKFNTLFVLLTLQTI